MPEAKEFTPGDRVRVTALPPYVKTAEPMPMLRPPHVIRIGEEGVVLDRRPGGYWGVRLTKGSFLLESQYLEAITDKESESSEPHRSDSEDTFPIPPIQKQ